MATVFIDRKYNGLCTRLVDDKIVSTGEKIFNIYMDLAIFAALVAVNKGRTPIDNNGPEIPDRVFFNNEKEGLIYLISLLDTRDPYILKDEKQCFKIFQEYVNTGLSEISGWLTENATDATGVDTLLNIIAEKASQLLYPGEICEDLPAIDF